MLLLFSESKEFLANVIDDHIESRAYQHGNVLYDGLAEVHTLQSVACQWQGQTIGYQVAENDVEGKLENALPVVALIVEGEMLVEIVAEYATEEIVEE